MNSDAQDLSRHERRELRQRKREEERERHDTVQQRSSSIKKTVKWSLLFFVFLGVIFFFYTLFSQPKVESYTDGPVHWHAQLGVYVCGEKQQMPAPKGEHHLGLPLLHTHEDQLIHIEGQIWKKEDIMFGAYMDAINVPFSEDHILDFANGNQCNDGKLNKVHMFVNSKESLEFRQYIIHDKDKIEIRYE